MALMQNGHDRVILQYMQRDPRAYYAVPQLMRYLDLSHAEVLESLDALRQLRYVERRSPQVPLYTLTPAGIAATA
jgi:hypothetical protein